MIGKNIAPAAVLEINSVMNVPARQIAVITTIGLVPQMSKIPPAMRSAIPVFWIARPSTALPAKIISISQLIDRMACSGLQQRKMSIANTANIAHCRSDMTPSAESATIAIMIMLDTNVLQLMFGISSESKKCRSRLIVLVSVFSSLMLSSSRVSPACSTTSRGDCSIRLPRRLTATSVSLCSFSKPFVPIVVPIRLLPKLI